jgi:hypothetical protein
MTIDEFLALDWHLLKMMLSVRGLRLAGSSRAGPPSWSAFSMHVAKKSHGFMHS